MGFKTELMFRSTQSAKGNDLTLSSYNLLRGTQMMMMMMTMIKMMIIMMTRTTRSTRITPIPRGPSGKASASRAEDPGFESRLRRDFFGVESDQ